MQDTGEHLLPSKNQAKRKEAKNKPESKLGKRAGMG